MAHPVTYVALLYDINYIPENKSGFNGVKGKSEAVYLFNLLGGLGHSDSYLDSAEWGMGVLLMSIIAGILESGPRACFYYWFFLEISGRCVCEKGRYRGRV